MEQYKIPLVNGSGRTSGYGDRWRAHRVRDGPDGLILGEKHVGITIACLDDDGRILVQLRRHRIFDKVWSLSGEFSSEDTGYSTRFGASRATPTRESMTLRRWNPSLKPQEGVPKRISGL